MTRYVDAPAQGEPVGRCIVLPGREYTADGPLLFFAAETARHHGWDVRQVWWDAPARGGGTNEVAWVEHQLDAALDGHTGRVLLVAKSLGTLAAARAASLHVPAAWLTPLLTVAEAAAPLLSYPAPQLVVIGRDDPFLDHDVLDALPGTHQVVEGDHVLRVPGDPAAMVASHAEVVRALDAWLRTV